MVDYAAANAAMGTSTFSGTTTMMGGKKRSSSSSSSSSTDTSSSGSDKRWGVGAWKLSAKASQLSRCITEIEIEAKIMDLCAEVKMAQTYQNTTGSPIEAVYEFPLFESLAIVEFIAEINGKEIVAKERHGAFLGEVSNDKRKMFKISVGNLPVGQTAKITITCVMELETDLEDTIFSLPVGLFPRDPVPLSIKMLVMTTFPIKDVVCTSHSDTFQILPSTNPFQKEAIWKGAHGLWGNSFECKISSREQHRPAAAIESAPDGSLAALVTFFPSWANIDSDLLEPSGEIVFLIDRSGSMAGSSISKVSETMALFLRSLPMDCKFNIVGFGDRFEKLFPTSMKYDDTSLQNALNHVQDLKANLGGTELLAPLLNVLTEPVEDEYPRQVFVLTDGAVSKREATIDAAAKNCQRARVFTFGIGTGVDQTLVSGLAAAGRGKAEFITETSQIKEKVMLQLQRALEPMMKQVTINWPAHLHSSQAPTHLRPLFSGERLLAYAMFPPGENLWSFSSKSLPVVLSGIGPEGTPLSFEIPLEEGRLIYGQTIHRLAAKVLIREMEETIRGSSRPDLNAQILDLSLKWNVASSLTAFSAVDKRSEETLGSMKTITVPSSSVPPRKASKSSTTSTSSSLKKRIILPTVAPPKLKASSSSSSSSSGKVKAEVSLPLPKVDVKVEARKSPGFRFGFSGKGNASQNRPTIGAGIYKSGSSSSSSDVKFAVKKRGTARKFGLGRHGHSKADVKVEIKKPSVRVEYESGGSKSGSRSGSRCRSRSKSTSRSRSGSGSGSKSESEAKADVRVGIKKPEVKVSVEAQKRKKSKSESSTDSLVAKAKADVKVAVKKPEVKVKLGLGKKTSSSSPLRGKYDVKVDAKAPKVEVKKPELKVGFGFGKMKPNSGSESSSPVLAKPSLKADVKVEVKKPELAGKKKSSSYSSSSTSAPLEKVKAGIKIELKAAPAGKKDGGLFGRKGAPLKVEVKKPSVGIKAEVKKSEVQIGPDVKVKAKKMSKSTSSSGSGSGGKLIKVTIPSGVSRLTLENVISKQQANGTWDIAAVTSLLGVPASTIESVCPLEAYGHGRDQLWCTVLMVSLLESLFQSSKTNWALLVQKARKQVIRLKDSANIGRDVDLYTPAAVYIKSLSLSVS
ncbi:hypothetical protein Pelo_6725 [Pelomyxa schiedti]|nr:hypothetical protein Pelo_6725 [Pelomyxa schiedti]